MSKISNKTAYPAIAPVLEDYFVLTDSDSDLATKTCTLTALKNLFEAEANNVTVEVSAANLKTILTPYTLIAAPGAGKVIEVLSIFAYMDAGSSAFDFGQNVKIQTGNNVWATYSNTSFMNSVADVLQHDSVASTACTANTALQLLTTSGNATVGNGILKVNIRYRVLTLSSF